MDWASKRKLWYSGGFLLVLIVFIGLPAFAVLYKKPSCKDRKQNQGEQGIDCGGPCVLLCKPAENNPQVQWQQTFKVTETMYTAAAYVHNPNLEAEAFNVPYTFSIYDIDNTLILEKKGVAYVPPRKSFLIMEAGLDMGDKVPARTFIDIGTTFSWQRAPQDRPEPLIENQLLTQTPTGPVITADLSNPTYKDISEVIVFAVVYGTDGNAFAVSRTLVDQLYRQTSKPIVFTWPRSFVKEVSRIEIIALPR
ncbi:MAG: hypothetical protein V4519_04740 [Patescibacteria group bacterium]